MADNTVLNAGSGGDTFGSDDIGGVKFPRGKLIHGADGVNDGDVSKANPLPVGGNTAADGSGTLVPLLVDAAGNLQVDVVTNALPTGAATAANQSTGNTALAAIQVAVEALDNAIAGSEMQVDVVSSALPSGAATAENQTTANTVLEAIQTSVQVLDNVVMGTGSGSVGPDFVVIGGWDGSSLGAVRIDGSRNLVVSLASSQTLDTLTTLTGSSVAHDAADSGNPHKIGAKATTSLAGLTLVANADRTNLFAGVDGVLITRPYANQEDIVSGVAAITDGSSTSVIAAAGSGVKIYITSIVISNTSATPVTVDIRDGAAGTVKATFPVPADTSGVVCNLPVPIPFSANTAVCADPSAAASTVTVTLVGYKSKV